MIINSVIGKVDGLEIDLKLSDGVNFIFYTDKSERLLYEKIFRLAFDEYAPPFSKNFQNYTAKYLHIRKFCVIII